jgi:hypothetical protein
MSSRGLPVTKQMRAERRKRAEEMRQEYDALSLEQKFAKLPPEPGAKKQRARLMALLQKQKTNSRTADATETPTDQVKPEKPKRSKKK